MDKKVNFNKVLENIRKETSSKVENFNDFLEGGNDDGLEEE